jgi:hypothetical protein
LYGAHANYYSFRGAKYMFDNTIKDLYFFDRNYHFMFDYFKTTSFICYPNLVVSDISTTNIGHKYTFFSDNEKHYYTNCFKNFKFSDYNFIYLYLILKNKNIYITDKDTYNSYINKLLECSFKNEQQQQEIKNRLVMDFFTIKDIEFLLSF